MEGQIGLLRDPFPADSSGRVVVRIYSSLFPIPAAAVGSGTEHLTPPPPNPDSDQVYILLGNFDDVSWVRI